MRCKQWRPRVSEFTVKGGGEVARLIEFQTSKNTKDLRLEEEKKQDVIGGKGACWDEWLHLEKPDAA